MYRLAIPFLVVFLFLSSCMSKADTKPNPQSNKTDEIEMVYVPSGDFEIWGRGGDSKNGHIVLLDAFYIDKYEVTNAAYEDCVIAGICQAPKETLSYTRSEYYGNPEFYNYPVIYVNWFMANTYCEWRNARLPTETEWEKAARGTDGRKYPWGEVFDVTYSNISDSMEDTTSVGTYESGKSVYGAYDMVGNVWEWVSDWYDDEYYYVSLYDNPQGPVSGERRVIRGGSFTEPEYNHETYTGDPFSPTYRFGWFPDRSNNFIGFRCARSP
jgi:formylglycine-generating enzyme required for sulfatase activity